MSDVPRAWPIPDAGLCAARCMIEALMGAMGTATRWRTRRRRAARTKAGPGFAAPLRTRPSQPFAA